MQFRILFEMIEKPDNIRYNYRKINEGLVLLSNKADKPKLTSRQLVIKMRDEKGISFKYDSEDDAAEYLSDRNNYLRTACYRVSYQKYSAGANTGKYMNLDFAYLKELSVIDMHYRFLVKRMSSDIEHSISVNLLKLSMLSKFKIRPAYNCPRQVVTELSQSTT